jgi:hypothetical protein
VITLAVKLETGGRERIRWSNHRFDGAWPEDRIHDLLDPLDFESGFRGKSVFGVKAGPEKIYDLVDVVERKPRMALVDTGLHDEIMKRAVEIAEKIARDVIPDIAERVIREEIEKLKKDV